MATQTVWLGFSAKDCHWVLSNVLGTTPRDAVDVVADSLLPLAEKLAEKCTNARREATAAFLVEQTTSQWSKMQRVFGIPSDCKPNIRELQMRLCAERDSNRGTRLRKRCRLVWQSLVDAIKAFWKPDSWTSLTPSMLRSLMVHHQRSSLVPPKPFPLSMSKVSEVKGTATLAEIHAMAEQAAKDCRLPISEVARLLLIVRMLKAREHQDEVMLALYSPVPPRVTGAPCLLREAKAVSGSYNQRLSAAVSTAQIGDAWNLVYKHNGLVLVSTKNSIFAPNTGLVSDVGGILCPVPGRPYVFLVSEEGKVMLIHVSASKLEKVSRFTVGEGFDISWASCELDDELVPYLIYGDRDPYTGSSKNVSYTSVGELFDLGECSVSPRTVAQVAHRLEGGLMTFDLNRQGSSLACVTRRSFRDRDGRWDREPTTSSAVQHGRHVVQAMEAPIDRLPSAVWGTPKAWVEVRHGGNVALSTIAGREIQLAVIRGARSPAISVCIVQCEEPVEDQDLTGL